MTVVRHEDASLLWRSMTMQIAAILSVLRAWILSRELAFLIDAA